MLILGGLLLWICLLLLVVVSSDEGYYVDTIGEEVSDFYLSQTPILSLQLYVKTSNRYLAGTIDTVYVTFIGDAVRGTPILIILKLKITFYIKLFISTIGILFSVTWPLVEALGGNAVDLGWATSLFSFGRVLITTRMGMLADKYRHRYALLIDGLIFTVGKFSYDYIIL
jgi:hypothetical protein